MLKEMENYIRLPEISVWDLYDINKNLNLYFMNNQDIKLYLTLEKDNESEESLNYSISV